MDVAYKRIVLKLSGEALNKEKTLGVSPEIISSISQSIKEAADHGTQIAIVIGGGNFIRGGQIKLGGVIDRATADHMGMLATMINALALRDGLQSQGQKSIVLSARSVDGVLETANAHEARRLLDEGYIVIFAGGTGNPFVTTDSAASLRAIEINADALLKATTVDGVYDKDPNKFADAKKFNCISFKEVLKNEFAVMDLGAFTQCRDFNIPICVFNLYKPSGLKRVLQGENEGTWVVREKKI